MEIQVRDEEIEMLLADVMDQYGYDFTDYAPASLKRRINRVCLLHNLKSFAELRWQLLNDPGFISHFVEELTVNVTEMFRDPSFFKTLRSEVFPILATYPLIRIWHAGCSTGEEVYSMAILLKEASLLHKSILYATDLSSDVVQRAALGIFPLAPMKEYSENYIEAGGEHEFSKYYVAKYDRVIFSEDLSQKMVFSTHNLVSDGSFNEFQLILCRNVMIYFNKTLQDKVLRLFDQSLHPLGFLGLGNKETIRFSSIEHRYRQINREKIWRKKT
jgi:Methylase of chemotaxis methyl-accepting proteins